MPINPKEIPFIRFLIPLIIGIISGFYFDSFQGWSFILLISLLVPLGIFAYFAISRKFQPIYFLLPILFFFLLGTYSTTTHLKTKKLNIPAVDNIENYIIEISGQVKKGKYYQARGILKNAIQQSGAVHPATGELHLTLEYLTGDTLLPGNLIGIQGEIKEIAGPKNPHAFDFKKFKSNEGISHSAFLKKQHWTMLDSSSTKSPALFAQKIQNRLSAILSHYIRGPNELAVANSLILGNRTQLDKTLQKAYSTTGALHVLAVSGLHVGIIYLLIVFFLKKLQSKKFKWIKLAIVLAGIWSFVLITGAAPSVIRAATMFSLMGIGTALQRYPNIYNILGQAAFFMLLYNPLLLFNVSFQLSFSAVFSIVFFQPKIYKYWIIDNLFGDYIWKLVSLGIAAQIGTLPISLFYFHQFPLFFWLSGIIVVPAASVILLVGLTTILSHFIVPPLALLLGKFLSGFIWLMNACIFSLEQLPGSAISNIYISPAIVAMLYFALFLIIFSNMYKKRKGIYVGFAMLALAFLPGWIKAWQAKQQNQLLVYHQSYATLIDHWSANQGNFYIEGPKKMLDLTQSTGGARAANLIRRTTPWPEDQIHRSNHYSILKLEHERIILLNQFPKKIPSTPIQAKGIILQNTPRPDWANFDKYFSVDFVVADGSNKPWIAQKWQEELSESKTNFKFWDTSSQGAFSIDLNK